MRNLFIILLVFIFTFVFLACDSKKTKKSSNPKSDADIISNDNDEIITDEETITDEDNIADYSDSEISDLDSNTDYDSNYNDLDSNDSDISDEDSVPSCKLDDSFLEPTSENYFVFRLEGQINSIDDKPVDGDFFAKLFSLNNEIIYNSRGFFLAEKEIFITANFEELPVIFEDNSMEVSFTTVRFDIDSLNELKLSGESVFDKAFLTESYKVKYNSNNDLERICHIGINHFEKKPLGNETKLVPEGKLKFCFDDESDFSVGSTLRVAGNFKMAEGEKEILDTYNALHEENGEDIVETNLCTCYNYFIGEYPCPPENLEGDSCQNPFKVKITGSEVKNLSGSTQSFFNAGSASCGGWMANDVFYQIELTEDALVDFELIADFDSVLYLKANCSKSEIDCNDDSYLGYKFSSYISQYLEKGTYIVGVDGVQNASGNYWLKITADTKNKPYEGDVCAIPRKLDLAQDSVLDVNDSFENMKANYSSSCGGKGIDKVYLISVPENTFLTAEITSGCANELYLRKDCFGEDIVCGNNYYGESAKIETFLAAGSYYLFLDGYSCDYPNFSFKIKTDSNTCDPNPCGKGICEMKEDLTYNCSCDEGYYFNGITCAEYSKGAFKVVNSWGEGGWENKPDGHYWITYNSMKQFKTPVYYYYNNFNNIYKPTVLAEFEVEHADRSGAIVILGVGDPKNPIKKKYFQAGFWEDYFVSGALPFPKNKIVVDISEFAPFMNEKNIFLQLKNMTKESGRIISFAVEFYAGGAKPAFKKIYADNNYYFGAEETVSIILNPELTNEEYNSIQPLTRAVKNKFLATKPGLKELERDKKIIGVFKENENYNKKVFNIYGTGLRPPTEIEWKNMLKLRSYKRDLREPLPLSVDHSKEKYFPPIGNQGWEGSCVAFSMGYYIHTYFEAKEHDWDLSSTKWVYDEDAWVTNAGEPDSNQDKIISPDFIYHQVNQGADGGTWYSIVGTLLTRIGASSWATMPYNMVDHTSWPEENAWREAVNYRGREVVEDDFTQTGYFIIEKDSDIELLKSLIADGYLVSIGVKASDSDSIYLLLDSNDVVENSTLSVIGTNHANTVVGYKELSDWDIKNPDL